MLGLMQQRQLALPMIFHRMEEVFPESTINFVRDGRVLTTSYSAFSHDVRKVVSAMFDLVREPGARVATLCANTYEHLLLYYAVPCAGLVLHTVNHRLSKDQIRFILADAGARVLVIDSDVISELPSPEEIPAIEKIVIIGDIRYADDPRVIPFSDLLSAASQMGDFVVEDENQAASICYTSGTTGLPKGVVYSHRSIVLVALMSMSADVFGICASDVVMPIVPMFHANAWGLPYAAAFAGSDLVLPGHHLTSTELVHLMESRRVSVAAAVATVWRDMLPHASGRDWHNLRRLLTGGGPLPVSLSRAWLEATGRILNNSWGMTELGPIGTVARLSVKQHDAPDEQRLQKLSQPGYPAPLVRLRIGDELDTSGTVGELQAAGPTVASGYIGAVGRDRFSEDGWLRTGDLAEFDSQGELRITDRLKDVIKSGGEWISSIDLENMIMEHPAVAEAAVIAVKHERWDERPVAFVVLQPQADASLEDLIKYLQLQLAKFWIPDRIIVRDDLPRTSTGKISKSALREHYDELVREQS